MAEALLFVARVRIPSAPARPPHMTTQCELPAKPAVSAAESVTMLVASIMVGAVALVRRRLRIVVVERLPGVRVERIELAVAHCPDECPAGQDHQCEAQRD